MRITSIKIEERLKEKFYFNKVEDKDLVKDLKNSETRVKTRVKIIELISKNPNITNQELADELELTVKGIEWQMKKLKEDGELKRVGPAKGGYWKILIDKERK